MSPPRERGPAYGPFAQLAAPAIEVLDGPAHAEITSGTDIATAEVPREKPLGRPPPKAADGRERLDHLVICAQGERVEIQLARHDLARQTHDILGLASGELHAPQITDA